jgi:frataxin-like iron-binding protein CyaY
MIYSMAEIAEAKQAKDVSVRSQPQNLIISRQQQKIVLASEPQLRQLFYSSSLSGQQRFSIVGARWVNQKD